MISETEGIVLRQVKAANGRRLVTMLSKKYGKISVGASVNEGGKQKSSLIISPFSYGKYQLYKGREIFNLNGGQLIKSFFSVSEDFDKYMACAYVLELTDKLLPEEMPQTGVFKLVLSFLTAIEKRKKKFDTLVVAYMVKLLAELGTRPVIDACACCGEDKKLTFFSVTDGGLICGDCRRAKLAEAETDEGGQDIARKVEKRAMKPDSMFKNQKKQQKFESNSNEALIFCVNFGIVDIFRYCEKSPFTSFDKIALEDDVAKKILELLRSFVGYHFEVGRLKCEELLATDFAEGV